MKMWDENSLCYKMDYLAIHNHRQLFITLPVCTLNLVETVWDFACLPWRANFLSRILQKFWQLLVLFLSLREMNELMRSDKRIYLMFPWRLGWKLVVFLYGTGSWTIPWHQCLSHSYLIRPKQLSLFGKAFNCLCGLTSKPELAHLL